MTEKTRKQMTDNQMTEKTRKLIHDLLIRSYQLGQHAVDSIEILEYFKVLLDDALAKGQIPVKDAEAFALFIRQVELLLDGTKNSATNEALSENVVKTTYAIARWIYVETGDKHPLTASIREKPLESALTKCYNRAVAGSTEPIKDRFSILYVYLINSIEGIYTFTNLVIGIISGLNRTARRSFLNWIEGSMFFSSSEKQEIYKVLKSTPVDRGKLHGTTDFDISKHPGLEIPTSSRCLYEKFFKDYIANPKWNGYQGIQGVFRFDAIGGLFVETRFLTANMEDNAEYGTAAHGIHKAIQSKQAELTLTEDDEADLKEDNNKSIFHLRKAELKELEMDNFKGYKQPLSDRLNIYNSRVFHNSSLTRFGKSA